VRQRCFKWLGLVGLGGATGCLGRGLYRPPGQGPFLSPAPVAPSCWGWAWLGWLAGGVALGLGLALGLRWRRVRRAREAGAGGLSLGGLEALQGALALVEQVFTGCQRRLKVVDFDAWVAKRRAKREPGDEPPED
jgi:hypothetical protein